MIEKIIHFNFNDLLIKNRKITDTPNRRRSIFDIQ